MRNLHLRFTIIAIVFGIVVGATRGGRGKGPIPPISPMALTHP